MYVAELELDRLLDLMPASGRMVCKVVRDATVRGAIATDVPYPWKRARLIRIHLDRWGTLPQEQRDLLFLRAVCWLTAIRWFKPSFNQAVVAGGLVGMMVELWQGDAIGVVAAGGLVGLAGSQIWKSQRSPQRELEADEAAITVAQRRGYGRKDAARYLLDAIAAQAKLERRSGLNYLELVRTQNLKAIAQEPAIASES
jgi:hypothetical protein